MTTLVQETQRVGARDIARALGLPPPTAEQVAAIEQQGPGEALHPTLVVAGAGSGKTETMAARVVYLVANGTVRPERVLGLTFTKKAARELADRIRRRLDQLSASRLLGSDTADLSVGEPTVATYHAYAGRLFAEHALRAGREPAVRLLTETATWQFALRAVDAYDGEMDAVEWQPPAVTGAVLALAGELAEHLCTAERVEQLCAQLEARIARLPRGDKQRTAADCYAPTRDFLAELRTRRQLLPLVAHYTQLKTQADALDFGDQVALSARIAQQHTVVGQLERDRYGLVLLDEYQDTSHAQRVLLTSLFGNGHPVTAVGDPCQSIYGWRGASAGNLRSFPTDFPDADGSPAEQVDLTVSFRNRSRILTVANSLSRDLRGSGVPVKDLRPGPQRQGSGEVVIALHEHADAEAEWVADQVARLVAPTEGAARYSPREVAVLARRRTQFERIEAALRDRGLPVEVSGIGGLLATPEVLDVVATLQVLADPTAGDAVVRLLTGARWRLGPADLAALGRRAAALARRDRDMPDRVDGADAEPDPDPDEVDERSLVDALDDPGSAAAYSPEGHRRLLLLRAELRALRARADQPLTDLAADVMDTLRLPVEVGARPGAQASAARGHLDRFLDTAAEFSETEEEPTLRAFLAYLVAAKEREHGLDAGRIGVPGDAVQLLTVHGAKGLEWPVVVVPGLCEGIFPGEPQNSTSWVRNPRLLPFPLRGDIADLPSLDLDGCADQLAVRDALVALGAHCKERDLLEERRLIYVAVTRARDVLLASGYWWDHTKKPRQPSRFLLEMREVSERLGLGSPHNWADPPVEAADNPLDVGPRTVSWPLDPLTPQRRRDLSAAAALVREPGEPAALGQSETGADERSARWSRDVGLLLVELARAADEGPRTVVLPGHLSVSQLVALRRDPAELARQIRRPMPAAPAPLARRGTAFHAWLEERYAGTRLLDLDELPGAADENAAPDEELTLLRERFLASSWAPRTPVEVEVPFHAVVEGVVLRGRIDAVFADEAAGYDVVDWKTGRRPTGRDAAAATVQLAAYRLAWAALAGVPVER
ncbi:MAG: ATP-dependent helicase, partial [Actinomycetota bacterium]|nr:ATP-dependent helicase [Actinomycetota bacterium]